MRCTYVIPNSKKMKAIQTPKDGKTFCANGKRFLTMQEVHTYAADRDMFVSGHQTVGVFTMCDLTSYETGTKLSQSEIVDLFIGN